MGTITRLLTAVAFSMPGLLLTLAAKPLRLGDGALLVGMMLALTVPVIWLTGTPDRKDEGWPRREDALRSGE